MFGQYFGQILETFGALHDVSASSRAVRGYNGDDGIMRLTVGRDY